MSYPYRVFNKADMVQEFKQLRKSYNPRHNFANSIVDYGTERQRLKTKYKGYSNLERWRDPKKREGVLRLANFFYENGRATMYLAIRDAIRLKWCVNFMRPAVARDIIRRHGGTNVLDFTAGWGGRMIGAMSLDMNYTGIDINKDLVQGYQRILNLVSPLSSSRVSMIFQDALSVDYSKKDDQIVVKVKKAKPAETAKKTDRDDESPKEEKGAE